MLGTRSRGLNVFRIFIRAKQLSVFFSFFLFNSRSLFFVLQGSDPRVATCRGKLQNKRSKLNQEINKELRLRAGAENLFK